MTYPAYVYALVNTDNARVYVGITSNPKRRYAAHMSALRSGRHPVEDMQTDFSEHGARFGFLILDEAKNETERRKEFHWQRKLNSLERGHGYNYKDPVTRWLNRRV